MWDCLRHAPKSEGRCNAAGGDSPYAVLDKLVPGYYHRRTEQGDICASCCCNNTATEHLMAERLVIDDITHWARTYKVMCRHACCQCASLLYLALYSARSVSCCTAPDTIKVATVSRMHALTGRWIPL